MRLQKYIGAFFVSLLLSMAAMAQCDLPTTKGTDFWVAFLHNNGEAGTPELKLTATGDQAATVIVNNPNTGWTAAWSMTTPAYSNAAHIEITIPHEQGLLQQASQVTGYGLHVTATSNVWLSASNIRLACGDAAMVLPTSQLGTRYIVQDYPNTSSSSSASIGGCEIVLLATEDSTEISMTLPCTTQPNTVPAGSTLTVTLQRGETYLLVTQTPNQFTGMVVTSNNKPFALFQGNRITSVPNGNYSSGDHIYEQAVPVDAWGTDFVAIPTNGRSWGDMVRITAGDASCTVDIDGVAVVSLSPHGNYDYHLLPGSAKHIHTSTPASATLVMASSTWNAEPGDVSSVTLTPMSAGVCDAIFRMEPTERCSTYFVAVATTQNGTAGMTLDGSDISSQFSGSGTYRHALIGISQGNHRLQCTGGTFSAYAYAKGNVESYAFPLGRSFADYDNDTVVIYDTVCQGQPVDTMGVYLPQNVTATPGDTLVVRDLVIGSVRTHFELYITVMPTYSTTVYDTIDFDDTLYIADTALTEMGVHWLILSSQYGCDSMVTVVLAVRADTVVHLDTTCQGVPYSGWGFSVANPQADMALDRDTVVDGQPHHYRLLLTVLPSPRTTLTDTIALGDTLRYADTAITSAGTYLFRFTAANGCDSTVALTVVYMLVEINADKDGICPGEQVTLTASGTNVFIWTSSPYDASLDAQQGLNPITVSPSATTTYSLVDANGATVAMFTVGIDNAPALCIDVNHSELDFDNPVLIFTDCSEGRHHTVWTFADGSLFSGERLRRQFRHPLPDSVIVTMTTCNQYDCCVDTTIALPMKIRSIWFPNIFTPNAESNNRFQCFTSFDVESFSLVIYNRWGLELWSTDDINQPWDGRRADGTPCPQGAYVYRYWMTSPDGTFKSGIGTITILR